MTITPVWHGWCVTPLAAQAADVLRAWLDPSIRFQGWDLSYARAARGPQLKWTWFGC
jgi:hypothetical protein